MLCVLLFINMLCYSAWSSCHGVMESKSPQGTGRAGITGIRDRGFGLSSHFFDDGNMAGVGNWHIGLEIPLTIASVEEDSMSYGYIIIYRPNISLAT
jgi:hypothetical protein